MRRPGMKNGRNPARTLVAQGVAGLDDAFEATDARTDHHTGGDLVFTALRIPAGILERHVGGGDAEQDELVDLALFLGLHPVVRIERSLHRRVGGNRTGNLCGDVADIERRDT
jgi:hypothetical protein